MKKSVVALAALAVVGIASAQSSVTVFGTLDAAVAIGNGDVSNRTRLVSSAYQSSRLGFRGERGMSNNLKASFWIEGSLSNDTGAGAATNSNNQAVTAAAIDAGAQGLTFNRRATMSLAGNFGEVRLGRDYTPHYYNHAFFDPFGNLGVGASRAFVGSAGGLTVARASNTVGYFSPVMSGFKVQVQTYFGENASTAPDTGSGSSLRATYDQGPLSLGLAYGKTNTGAGLDVQSTNIGGSYDLGVAKLMGAITKDQNTNVPEVTGMQFGAHIPVSSGTVRVSVSSTDNGANKKTTQYALGYVHNLDKDTNLYATFASVSNSGGASAALNAAATPVNGSSTGFDFGIKYSF